MQDRIIELLGFGLPHKVVAEAVGVDPSYISQLMANEHLRSKVQELRAERTSKEVEKDVEIGELEKLALDKLKKLLPLQTDAMRLGKLFQILNGAKRHSDPSQGIQPQIGNLVQITVSPEAQIMLQMTPDKQVIAVNNRSMVPLPSSQVSQKLKEQKALKLLQAAENPKPVKASLIDDL